MTVRDRRSLNKKDTIRAVLRKFKKGTLHMGKDGIVKKHTQALAIALSEASKKKR